MRETTEQSDSQSALAERLRRIEERLDAIEQWQRRERVVSPATPESTPAPPPVVEAAPVAELPGEELQFDLGVMRQCRLRSWLIAPLPYDSSATFRTDALQAALPKTSHAWTART